ncbi:glycosyltransferase [Acidobacteria bacterium AB60]|nr:glycosyltransferase [Acidobacteria bacterium AB60]
MARKYTILLLIPHLGGGGAERVMAHLARSLPCSQLEVHLGVVVGSPSSSDALFPRLHRIKATRVLFGTPGLLRIVRQLKPDLILSGMFHLNQALLLLRPLFPRTTRILVRQNGMLAGRIPALSRWERLLYRVTYRKAEGIISQTSDMAKEITQLLGQRAPVHVLRNPVDLDGIRRSSERLPTRWGGPGPHLLAIGRLSPEKGFDLLLDAFAEVRLRHPRANLTILGEGPDRLTLEARSVALGLGGKVRFAGYVSDPAAWFPGTSLLVLPSRNDALPNVLLEGAAAGLPIVATPCSTGVAELLHGKAGIWLARDCSAASLAESLKAALAVLRTGQRFRHDWLEPFNLPRVTAQYRQLILQTVGAE